jgi:parallel beta-helix repeat protein
MHLAYIVVLAAALSPMLTYVQCGGSGGTGHPSGSPAPIPTGSGTAITWYVATNGSNTNPCTQALPCATPDYAFNSKTAPGETVLVSPGVYDYGSNAARFSKSGANGRYITVTCATRWTCTIRNSVTGNRTFVYLEGNHIAFDGFEVTNTSIGGNNLGIYVTSTNDVKITRNRIHHIETDCGQNGGGGIQLAGSGSSPGVGTNMLIDSNLIYDISWSSCQHSSSVQTDGILAETAGGGITITNNIVYHVAGGWGIVTGNGSGNAQPMLIRNNTVFSNGNGGIAVVGGTVAPVITHNIVVNNGLLSPRCGISLPSGLPSNMGQNDLWNNAGGNYCIEWGSSDQSIRPGDIAIDPARGTTFLNWQADGSGDYRVKASGPASDRGAMGF